VLTADIFGPDLIIVIVVGVVVLLFGGSKLPKLARGLGSASHEFKKGLEEGAADSKAPGSLPAGQPAAVTPPPAPQVEGTPPKDASAG
jgi:sec-independent protein translocase protein TatA